MASGVWRWIVGRLARGELAAAQAEAKLARDRLTDAIEAISEGVVFLDAEGRYVLWNRRYARRSTGCRAWRRPWKARRWTRASRGWWPASAPRPATWSDWCWGCWTTRRSRRPRAPLRRPRPCARTARRYGCWSPTTIRPTAR